VKTQELLKKYEENQILFSNLKKAGEGFLGRALTIKNIKHDLDSRIKEFDSLLKKATEKKLGNPLAEMTDIVGLRVVCLFRSDVEKAKEVIRETFSIIKEDEKRTKMPKNLFDFAETHFDVKLNTLPDNRLGFDEKGTLKRLSEIVFEIQVRTICEHAWISTSHNLFYKSDNTVPQIIERDFYAINGLFYIADTHFEIIKKESSRSIE